MTLSWDPVFHSISTFFWEPGDPDFYFLDTTPAGWTSIIFTLRPADSSMSMEFHTEQVIEVFGTGGPLVGNLTFSVWTLTGPSTDDLIEVVVGEGLDPEKVSWSIISAKFPIPDATIVLDENVEGLGTATVANPLGGITLGCVVSIDTGTDPSFTWPGDHEEEHEPFAHSGDPTEATMLAFASDLPGDFELSSAFMRRVVLFGAPPQTDSWHVGGVGRSW